MRSDHVFDARVGTILRADGPSISEDTLHLGITPGIE
jgi:hypothetical protein